ncbi:TetR/AcrR family transcriptional regulator [Microbacterium sp. P03]|uniref:TetR/AcrR family transcriptional regulator n=1 Tax=Microbacterium sp. P03 TaxID=3366946 RepID=UPI0037476ED7
MPRDANDTDRERARGTYAKGIARRQEILDRAIEVFAARGAEKTSLRAIAERIGVSHAALTHYFSSREQLLVEVYREAAKREDDHEATLRDLSPVEMMAVSAERNREVPGLVQLYSTLVASAIEDGHPAATEFARERFADLRDTLATQIADRQERGLMRRDVDPHAIAALVIAASDGLQIQWLLDADAPQDEALAMLSRMLEPPRC